MTFEIRPHAEDEMELFRATVYRGFGGHPSADPEALRQYRERGDISRTLAAFDDDEIVGTANSFLWDMTLPGGDMVPSAAVSAVTVSASHRRRGIFTSMMRRLLDDAHERDEPCAILWASESIIYGRFGYGMAIQHEHWSIETRHRTFASQPPTPGRVRFVTPEEAKRLFPGPWERERHRRPGMTNRSDVLWESRLYDPEHERWGGFGGYFHAVYEQDGSVDGYVLYRRKWEEQPGAGATLRIVELVTATDAAYAALWRFCLEMDLVGKVEADRPVGEPLWWMLADPRRLRRIPFDAIWLRILDVPEMLTRRRYAAPGKLVLQVEDDFCPWAAGRYELDGGPDGARCQSTNTEPDISLSTAELAAISLGGAKLAPMARAARVEEHTAGSLARADAMFAADPPPWCPQGF
ncbi:MAG: GNAT family N-acetyltransferase [Dehalococcoidia bacterium]